jgi:hypothetical protein
MVCPAKTGEKTILFITLLKMNIYRTTTMVLRNGVATTVERGPQINLRNFAG